MIRPPALRLKATLVFLSVFGISVIGLSQLLVEHFDYPNGRLGDAGVGSALWTGGDSPSTAVMVTNVAALVYPGLTDCCGAGVLMSGGTFKKKAAPFGPVSSGEVYVSFLLSIGEPGNASKLILYLQNGNSASSSPPLGVFLNGTTIGIAKYSSSPQATISGLGVGPHLIVVRYRFLSGNDEVALWLDPPTGLSNPPTPTLIAGGNSSSDAPSLSYIFLNHGVNQSIYVDEIRVGTNWSEVFPLAEQVPSVKIEGGLLPAENRFYIHATGSVPGRDFELLSSRDLTLPINNWEIVGWGTTADNGTCEISVPMDTNTARFYAIRVLAAPRPRPPIIIQQPVSLVVTSSQTAVFCVVASGTQPLWYQWYFNGGEVLNATNPTYVIENVQESHGGQYFVVVSNSVGTVTSSVVTLTVSNVLVAPFIIRQPESKIVGEGEIVTLSVSAGGTMPLWYMWYKDPNLLLSVSTNAFLVLGPVTTNDSGNYYVIVTNSLGLVTSSKATIMVQPSELLNVDFNHIGYASEGINLTGGAGGPVVTVSNATQLRQYTDANGPYVIYVVGTIPISGMDTHIRPNKTVIGYGTNATLVGGGLYLYRSTNVIIRNLTIIGSTEDGIGIHYSTNVWIDHCTIADARDGLIDITQQSDLITVSWCRFYYTINSGHNFCNLIASSDSDTGNYRVTFHHNWWGELCVERMPSVRFGRAHIFNNYYNAPGNNYCIRSRLYAECRIENNWFENVQNPWEVYITSGQPGKVYATGNKFVNVKWYESPSDGRYTPPGNDTVFAPPYTYSLHPVDLVPTIVTRYAGAGRGPFASK